MEVGFSVVVREGQAEFQFFGRRPGEPRSLASYARLGDQHAVLMGRLTYRSEVLARLPKEDDAPAADDDVGLALAAYCQWGAAGLARLEGTFALAIWDAEKQLLVGVRDPFGGYPLYWTNPQGAVAFGTCLRPLLQLLPTRTLNLDHAAEFLSAPGVWVQEVQTEQCAYEGVHRVLSGGVVEVQAPGGQVRKHAPWNWLDHAVDPGTDRLEELAPMVAERLKEAVRQNLRGCVASHLSGGMDSAASALLARHLLQGEPGQPPVHAISAVFDGLGGLNRETPYLESALNGPGLVSHRIRGEEVLDYDGFADPPFHDEPFTKLPVLGVVGVLAEKAAEAGADTLLTGEGSDGVLDVLPHHLSDQLRRGRLFAAYRDARAWGRAANASAWLYLWNFGIVNLLPAGWRAGLGAARQGGLVAWERQGPGTVAPWVRPDFAHSRGLRERGLAHLRRECAPGRPMNVSKFLYQLWGSCGDGCRWFVAAPRGMTLIHPFLDPRLVGLGLGIQTRYRQEPGRMKPLLADALRGVLPDMIRNRRRKGYYNSMNHTGLVRNLPRLEALVREAPVDDLDLFDKGALLQCLQQASVGLTPFHGMYRLHLTLSWLRWYSLQDEWQRPVTPATVIRAARADAAPAGCPA